MKINLSNSETSDISLFDVSIVQKEVGGEKNNFALRLCQERSILCQIFLHRIELSSLIIPE